MIPFSLPHPPFLVEFQLMNGGFRGFWLYYCLLEIADYKSAKKFRTQHNRTFFCKCFAGNSGALGKKWLIKWQHIFFINMFFKFSWNWLLEEFLDHYVYKVCQNKKKWWIQIWRNIFLLQYFQFNFRNSLLGGVWGCWLWISYQNYKQKNIIQYGYSRSIDFFR